MTRLDQLTAEFTAANNTLSLAVSVELCRRLLAERAERGLAVLRRAVAKMSHRKCWDCGNVAYHLLDIVPYVLCEKCGSQDTRLIRKPKGDPNV